MTAVYLEDIDEIPTTRDLSWAVDVDLSDSWAQTEGVAWDREQVEAVIASHEMDPAAFLDEEGEQPLYRAWAVLDWLGY